MGVFCVPDADGSNRPVRVASGQSFCWIRGFCQFWFLRLMLFCCFSVGLKKYEPLLCPRNLAANRGSIPADFGASVFFLTPSLLYRKGAGHRQSHAVPSCSWLSRFAPSPFANSKRKEKNHGEKTLHCKLLTCPKFNSIPSLIPVLFM